MNRDQRLSRGPTPDDSALAEARPRAPDRHGFGAAIAMHVTGLFILMEIGVRIWTRGTPSLGGEAFNPRVAAMSDWFDDPHAFADALILWMGLFMALAVSWMMRKSQTLKQNTRALQRANSALTLGAKDLAAANASLEERAGALQRAESCLLRSNRDKRDVLDSLSAFLIGIDESGRIAEWNLGAQRVFGVSGDSAAGRSLAELEAPWELGRIDAAIRECLASGERVQVEEIVVSSLDDMEERLVSMTINPVMGEAQAVRGCSIIGTDVTERNRLERKLQNTSRLEATGSLASGIAHEINTPIQFIGDNVQFVTEQLTPILKGLRLLTDLRDAPRSKGLEQPLLDRLDQVVEDVDIEFLDVELTRALAETGSGVQRVAEIVRAMKDFSHPGQRTAEFADLNRALANTLTVTRNEYKYHADVVTDFGELPKVLCHLGDLNQVFLNIIVNAGHTITEKVAGREGSRGTIKISTRREGDEVEVRIADDGCGISARNKARLFERFFTTKSIGRGTGQGLSMAWDIVVNKHEGRIEVESQVGVGTTFMIRLPIGAPDKARNHQESAHEHPVCR